MECLPTTDYFTDGLTFYYRVTRDAFGVVRMEQLTKDGTFYQLLPGNLSEDYSYRESVCKHPLPEIKWYRAQNRLLDRIEKNSRHGIN